ncbi:MAG TPA: hypothetical protein VIJ56_01275 [Acidimicrobiales bacterium]
MAGGRGRGGIHRRGWLHRRQHHRSAAHTSETADTTDVADVALPDSADETGGTSDETALPASFDQVLRRAAEARDAERGPDD